MIRRYLSTVLVLSVFAFSGWAQSPPHQHAFDPSQITVVDGSKNPELIPDSTIYRLFLLAVSTGSYPTEQEQARQDAHLTDIGLSGADRLQAVMILTNFKLQYQSLIKRYNESAVAALAQNSQPDERTFLQQRDDLVQATRDALKRTLSAPAMTRFDAHVQGERKHVRLHMTKEAQ